MNTSSIVFKDWLPDQPALNNPGLVDAKNALPINGAYKNYDPLVGSNTALPTPPLGAYLATGTAGSFVYAGVATRIYGQWTVGGGMTVNSATLNTATLWDFATYEDYVFAASYTNQLLYKTVGSATNFAAITAGPTAQHVAKIGQHVMVGKLSGNQCAVQWGAIDAPLNFPTPGSTTAIAAQAGLQVLDSEFGEVTGIVGGNQHGLIFQQSAITRATYVGGTTVFQFDRISAGIGAYYPGSIITVSDLTYFFAKTGVKATDGNSVRQIGAGKVDFHLESFDGGLDPTYPDAVSVTVDKVSKIIYWSYPVVGDSGVPLHLLVYNYVEDRFSRAQQTLRSLFGEGVDYAYGFDDTNSHGYFIKSIGGTGNSTSNVAVFETGDAELNPGGKAYISGVRADTDQVSWTAALASRDVLTPPAGNQPVTFGSATTANSRSGFANFRNTARYHRAKISVTGTISAMSGITVEFTNDGEM